MEWKETLRALEHSKQWDNAIEFMEDVIKKNPKDLQAIAYARYVLTENTSLRAYFYTKGSIGEYLLGMMIYESEEILGIRSYYP